MWFERILVEVHHDKCWQVFREKVLRSSANMGTCQKESDTLIWFPRCSIVFLSSLNWSTLSCCWVPPLFGAMPMRVTVFIFNGQVFFKKYVVVPPRGLWLAYPLRCRGYWIKYQWTTLSRSSHGSTGQVSRSRTDSELLFQSSPYQTQLRSWKSRGSARLGEGDQRNYFFIMINVLEYLYGRMVPGHG